MSGAGGSRVRFVSAHLLRMGLPIIREGHEARSEIRQSFRGAHRDLVSADVDKTLVMVTSGSTPREDHRCGPRSLPKFSWLSFGGFNRGLHLPSDAPARSRINALTVEALAATVYNQLGIDRRGFMARQSSARHRSWRDVTPICWRNFRPTSLGQNATSCVPVSTHRLPHRTDPKIRACLLASPPRPLRALPLSQFTQLAGRRAELRLPHWRNPRCARALF